MNSKVNVVIIDDDIVSVERLTESLADYPDMCNTFVAYNASDGLKLIRRENPKILFLDIELPDGNGVELVSLIKKICPEVYIVMFTAVYDQYASQAFTRDEGDYLLKPIDSKDLDLVIRRFRRSLMMQAMKSITQAPAISEPQNGRLAITTITSEIRVVRTSEIGYFKYSPKRRIWEVALSDGSIITLKKGTAASTIMSYNSNFVQSHQTYIVNLENVMMITATNVLLFPPFKDDEVLVSRTYRHLLQEKFTCM